jgi:hypothetical protein
VVRAPGHYGDWPRLIDTCKPFGMLVLVAGDLKNPSFPIRPLCRESATYARRIIFGSALRLFYLGHWAF